ENIKTRMTADEFLMLEDRDLLTQLIDGEIVMAPPPIPDHQRIVFKFAKLIDSLISNGEVFVAPIELLLDDGSVPQPDVVWVAVGGRCVIEEKRLHGAPELIIEVLSPGTARYDKIEKYKLYERHGISEYWIASPVEQYVEVFSLENGKFKFMGVFGAEQSFESPVLGGQAVDLTKIFDASSSMPL
ncbi:MAG: Uma2 family endonuclease, partial [Chitinophagaceae bacterium]|nr:Uma2 family endonuclease [Anaerolineae bacterium]